MTRKTSPLFSILLRVFPRRFREKHGNDLIKLCQDTHRGLPQKDRSPWRLAWNLIVQGLGARLDDARLALRERRNHAHQKPNGGEGALASLWLDGRHAVRSLARSPGYLAVATLTLALGIGGVTTIYTVVDGVLLSPLPYEDIDRLVVLGTTFKPGGGVNGASIPNYVDWRQRSTSFDRMGAVTRSSVVISEGGEPERLSEAGLFGDIFAILGARSAQGRLFSPADHEYGAPRVAVVSHGAWRGRWGGDPEIVGRTLTTDDGPITIVGVLPEDFEGPEGLRLRTIDLWTPRALDNPRYVDRSARFLIALARLRPGLEVPAARREMDAIGADLVREYPDDNSFRGNDMGVGVITLTEHTLGDSSRKLYVLLGAVALLLLIACVNVAHMALARGTGREREMALRAALGAGRGRLARLLAVESVVVSLLGGIFGVGLAYWGVRAFVAINPGDLPRLGHIAMQGRVLTVAVVVSLACGLLCALAPGLQLARVRLGQALKEGATTLGREGHRMRSSLVVGETALALMLLIGAGLLANSFVRLDRVDPGFDPAGITTLRVHAYDYGAPVDSEQKASFFRDLLRRVRAVPGVESAGAAVNLPIGDINWRTSFVTEGSDTSVPTVGVHAVTPGFLSTLGADIVKGRDLASGDVGGAPLVVLVNETLATQAFSDEPALGRRLRVDSEDTWYTVVGVVRDIKQRGLSTPSESLIYFSYDQQPYMGSMYIAVRAKTAPETLAEELRQAVWGLDPSLPLPGVRSLEKRVSGSIGTRRFYTLLLGSFASLALLLAAVGIFATMHYTVSRRRREIGIRMALGARRGDLVAMVLRQGMATTLVGIAAGWAGARGLSRFLESLLFDVAPGDFSTFAAVSMGLALVALVACGIPALLASRVDPVRTLRAD